MGRLSWIIRWSVNAITSVLVSGRQRDITDRRREGDVITEQLALGVRRPLAKEVSL